MKQNTRKNEEFRISKLPRGDRHAAWKGDAAGDSAKRMRNRSDYPSLEGVACERCLKSPAVDRHHRDEDPGNNAPANILLLCRRCHMEVDRRLDVLRANVRLWHRILMNGWGHGDSVISKPKPCRNCKTKCSQLRKGRCGRCDKHFRKYRSEWHAEFKPSWGRRLPCINCGVVLDGCRAPRRCRRCQVFFDRNGVDGPATYAERRELSAMLRHFGPPGIRPPCRVCGVVSKPYIDQRCMACYHFFKRTGVDRTKEHLALALAGKKGKILKRDRASGAWIRMVENG